MAKPDWRKDLEKWVQTLSPESMAQTFRLLPGQDPSPSKSSPAHFKSMKDSLSYVTHLDAASSQELWTEVGARWLPQIVEAFQLYPFSVTENQHLDLLNVVQETSAWAGYMRSPHGATFLKIAMEAMLESKYFKRFADFSVQDVCFELVYAINFINLAKLYTFEFHSSSIASLPEPFVDNFVTTFINLNNTLLDHVPNQGAGRRDWERQTIGLKHWKTEFRKETSVGLPKDCPDWRCCSGGLVQGCKKQGKGLMACGKCRSVYYCSAEHQKLHWKQGHKALCYRPVFLDA